jgi:outer membrane receptor protein involved in Fe transport
MDVPVLMKRFAPVALASALAFAAIGGAPHAATAQSVSAGSVTGTVTGADGSAIAGAAVVLQGPVAQNTTSDRLGNFAFTAVPPGAYTILVTKTGFASTQQEGVFVLAGSATTVNAALSPSSFSSLRTIGRVSTNAPGRATINTTPASITVLSQQVFVDQNQVQVTKELNETPGIITTLGGYSGTSLGTEQITQIRGALPYETESLIDGHPVSVSSDGSFSPTLLNPALLQNVEIVKGPGYAPTDINYAINGSVNYRTLEPTRTPQQTLEYGVDGYGGQFSSFQATGSTASHVLDYAFAGATNGTPSAVHDYRIAGSQVPLLYGAPPWTVNGQVVAQTPLGVGASNVPQFYGTPGAAQYNEPVYVCCGQANTGYHSTSELAKIRLNFSQQTALTLSYLGGQAFFDDPNQQSSLQGIGGVNESFSVFTPPAGYTGSVPAGRSIPFDTLADTGEYVSQQQNLLQAEFRTTLGATNGILARLYSGYTSEYGYQDAGNGAFTGRAWGGLLLCPAGAGQLADGNCGGPGLAETVPAMTYFNGTPVTFASTPVPSTYQNQDHLRGYSVEFDHTAGPNTYSLSFDRSHHDAIDYQDTALSGIVGFQLFPGSGQTFTTLALRTQLMLTSKLSASVNDYDVQYASHYTDDGGLTWHDATHSVNAPRLSVAWRPSTDVAVRFAAGESIAPPYIDILSAPGGAPVPNATGGATAYTLNQNNGNLAPETAFGYDLGLDKRLDRFTSFSADLYLTSLHNLFLPTTFQQGTYTPTSGADTGNTEPLFVTQTSNLAQARYEGVEVALQRAPPAGFGFRVQGSLMRAFTYNLPPGFYNTLAGPYTANLGVIPNVNFFGSNGFYDGTQGGRIPYAMGYGEANWRTRAGAFLSLGVTYYGSNNGYNLPAFAVVSASALFPLGKNTMLILSGDNLFGAYDQPFGYYLNGVPVPLANGLYAHATSGYLGVASGSNYGPATVRLAVRHRFGRE